MGNKNLYTAPYTDAQIQNTKDIISIEISSLLEEHEHEINAKNITNKEELFATLGSIFNTHINKIKQSFQNLHRNDIYIAGLFVGFITYYEVISDANKEDKKSLLNNYLIKMLNNIQ